MNESHNPWTVLSQRTAYNNKWIGVTEYDVINPGGGKGIYGKVHFKNLAIGVLPLDEKGYTWLVGQYRFTLDAYSWEIPEGGGDMAVPAVESAQRELKEETGLVAQEWTVLQEMHLSNSVSDERALIFLARQLEHRKRMSDLLRHLGMLAIRQGEFVQAQTYLQEGLELARQPGHPQLIY